MRLVVWGCWGGRSGVRAERVLGAQPDLAMIREAGHAPVCAEGSGVVEPGYEWHGEYGAKDLSGVTFGEPESAGAEPPAAG